MDRRERRLMPLIPEAHLVLKPFVTSQANPHAVSVMRWIFPYSLSHFCACV